MALYQDLPVFRDVYALTGKVFTFTQGFPHQGQFLRRGHLDTRFNCIVLPAKTPRHKAVAPELMAEGDAYASRGPDCRAGDSAS